MFKRILDFSFACAGLVVLSPIFLIISLCIKLSSKGPVFYLQTRIGKTAHEFRLIKFRTMCVGADRSGQLTIGNRDSRITNVGYFLRKFKLDELPQLINVLLGDMSLVGPRPEVKKYVDRYDESQRQVLAVRPGITDYASIMFVNENELLQGHNDPEQYYIQEIMPKKLSLNLEYIQSRSNLGDLRIIFMTLLAIFRK